MSFPFFLISHHFHKVEITSFQQRGIFSQILCGLCCTVLEHNLLCLYKYRQNTHFDVYKTAFDTKDEILEEEVFLSR